MPETTYKLKGFTIIELIITLIISSIIITSVYYTISLISRHYSTYTKTKSKIADIEIMNSNISYDFFNCEEVQITNNELLFISNSNRSYVLTDTSINNILSNTGVFANKITTTALWKNQIVFSGNIDELYIDILFLGDSLSIHYFKEYPLDKIIEINTNKILDYGY